MIGTFALILCVCLRLTGCRIGTPWPAWPSRASWWSNSASPKAVQYYAEHRVLRYSNNKTIVFAS